jgi:hypothetical protein
LKGVGVLDFLTDQGVQSAIAAIIGPLAFFAAPTEEIEHLLMADMTVEALAAPALNTVSDVPEGIATPA